MDSNTDKQEKQGTDIPDGADADPDA